jgi:quercetin dioxygenase-like cupin family protein
MALSVQRKFFSSIGDVLDDIRRNQTWPTTFVSGPSKGLPVHWHSEEVHAYIMEGETDFLDAESGVRTPVGPGDKIIVPAGALHAEGVVKDKVVYLLGLPAPLPPDEFLRMRSAEDLPK